MSTIAELETQVRELTEELEILGVVGIKTNDLLNYLQDLTIDNSDRVEFSATSNLVTEMQDNLRELNSHINTAINRLSTQIKSILGE